MHSQAEHTEHGDLRPAHAASLHALQILPAVGYVLSLEGADERTRSLPALQTFHRGIAAVGRDFMLNLIAYNLVRIPKLIAA